jgi:hypothetical protein
MGVSNLLKTIIAGLFLPVLFGNHQYISTPLHVVSRLDDLTWRGNKVMQSEITKRAGWTKISGWMIVISQSVFILLSDASPIKYTSMFKVNQYWFISVVLAPQILPLVIGVWLALINQFGCCTKTTRQVPVADSNFAGISNL